MCCYHLFCLCESTNTRSATKVFMYDELFTWTLLLLVYKFYQHSDWYVIIILTVIFLLFSTIGNFYFVDVWTVLIAVITLITKFKVNVVFHWCSNAIKRNIWACSWIFKRHLSDVHWTISKQTNFSQMLVWQLSFQDILNTIK